MKVNFTQLLEAFSLALDLGENRVLSHAKRTAYVAYRIGEALGVENLRELYHGGLLHDIGVTKTLSEEHFVLHRVKNHCDFGSQLVEELPISDNMVQIVKYHHENFDGSGPNGLTGNEIPIEAQIVYLADQFDIRTNKSIKMFTQRDTLVEYAHSKAGIFFNPEVVAAFKSEAKKERFWLDIENDNFKHIESKINDDKNFYTELYENELLSVAKVFGKIIDSKSRFTHNHSSGLADIVEKVAIKSNFTKDINLLKTSALLHDIGKLAVSREILEKPSNLSKEEFAIIKSHVYYTKYILGSIGGFKEISKIAGSHHEKLDGSGYADGLQGDNLSLYDRLLGVCDIYQALTEDRPYRKGSEPRQALKIIQPMVDRGSLCGQAFNLVKETVL